MEKKLLAIIATATMLASCNTGNNDIQYFPFQTEEDGEWGLISPNGKVLFKEEFKDQPTVVKNNRFWVQNNENEWELYTAEEKPKRIGKRYEQACGFNADVAPVLKKEGKKVDFINTDGEVVFSIAKVGGKPITVCSNFMEGFAIVKNTKYFGLINTKGEEVIKAEYTAIGIPSEGKIVAIHKKFEKKMDQADFTILSLKGEVISTFSSKKIAINDPTFREGKLIAYEKKNDEYGNAGIIDENGEWVFKPMKKTKSINDLKGGNFIFYDGNKYGVMSLEGNVIIRPKYQNLAFADESGKVLIAQKSGNDEEYKLIDLEDNQVGKDEWLDVHPFNGDYAFVKDGKKSWTVINKNGEEQQMETDIYNVTSYSGSDGIYITANEETAEEAAEETVEKTSTDEEDYGELESPPTIEDEPIVDSPTSYDSSGHVVFTGILNVDEVYFDLYADAGDCVGTFYNNKLKLTMNVRGTVSSNTIDVYSTDQKTRWHFYATQEGAKYKGTASNGSASYTMTLTRQ